MFEYSVQARNPVGYLSLALATSIVGLAVAGRLPSVMAPLAIVVMLVLAARLALNPRSGFRISPQRIEVFRPGFVRITPLAQVDAILISGRGRGSTLARLRLLNGMSMELPSAERICGQRLASALRDCGLRVLI